MSLRPLRRQGPKAGALWEEHKLLVRRSHTLDDEVMNTTKQRVKYPIPLAEEAVKVRRWHVETQLERAEMKESELLFPATTSSVKRSVAKMATRRSRPRGTRHTGFSLRLYRKQSLEKDEAQRRPDEALSRLRSLLFPSRPLITTAEADRQGAVRRADTIGHRISPRSFCGFWACEC